MVLTWPWLAAQSLTALEPVSAISGEVADGRLTVEWRECLLKDCLTALCMRLNCALYFDPAITNRVTASFRGQELEKSLPRLLHTVNYMIVWESVPDPKKGRIDRVAEIRVYRAGQDKLATLVVAPRKAHAPERSEVLGEADIRLLGEAVIDVAHPDRAGEAARKLAADGSSAAILALWKGVAAWNPVTGDGGDSGMDDPVTRAAWAVTNPSAFPVLLDRYLREGASENEQLATRNILGRMTDAEGVAEIRLAYGKADAAARERLEELVGAVTARGAERALTALAGPSDQAPAGPLARAALKGLSNLGTATATDDLLTRLEKRPAPAASGGDDLRESIGQLPGTPETVAALLSAATGNKRYSNGETRAAAVQALARFQDSRTLDLLQQLTHDPDPLVAQAAKAVLAVDESEE